MNTNQKEFVPEWHYVNDCLPRYEGEDLVSCKFRGKDKQHVYRADFQYGEFDIEDDGWHKVYAWARIPEDIPDECFIPIKEVEKATRDCIVMLEGILLCRDRKGRKCIELGEADRGYYKVRGLKLIGFLPYPTEPAPYIEPIKRKVKDKKEKEKEKASS